MTDLTQEELKKVLDYDPDTGVFRWLYDVGRARAGDVAGSVDNRGYYRIMYKRRGYPAHRLAFLWMIGEVPPTVDHTDQDKLNNSWRNIRPATDSQNQGNVGIRSDNKSGYKGVSWFKRDKKWKATIKNNVKNVHIGLFTCKHEAARAYNEMALELHGDFACLNEINA